MTFEQFAVAVHDWMRRLSPQQFRTAVERALSSGEGVEGLRRGISVGAALVMVQLGLGPGMRPVGARASEPVPPSAPAAKPAESVEHVPDSKVEVLEPAPEPPPRESKTAKRHHVRKFGTRGCPSKRAQALVREQLKHGPRPEATVMAAASCADIPESALIAAADSLGVRTRKGQWWLPQRRTL